MLQKLKSASTAMTRFIVALFFRLTMAVRALTMPRWFLVSSIHALIYGWNEIARNQTSIGQRVLCRQMLKMCTDTAKRFGLAEVPMSSDNGIALEITLNGEVPPLIFGESDWELMRDALEKHDATTPPDWSENLTFGDSNKNKSTNDEGDW